MSEALKKYRSDLWSQWKKARELEPHALKAEVVGSAHGAERVTVITWVLEKPFIAIQLYVAKFDDVVPVIRDLAKLGYHTNKESPYEDFHEIERRTYNLGPIRVMAFLRHEGATCRRVQVGVKEEPVYEFVCDEVEAQR